MSVVAKCLIEPIQAPASVATQYTAPGGVRTIIDKFTGTNVTGGAVALTVYLVIAAGTAGATNTVVSAKSLAAGECYTFPELVGHVLNPGDFIAFFAAAAASIDVRASGREVS